MPLERACGGGCPLTLALDPISKGSVVVDLGCGAGHDAIIAARMVSVLLSVYSYLPTLRNRRLDMRFGYFRQSVHRLFHAPLLALFFFFFFFFLLFKK